MGIPREQFGLCEIMGFEDGQTVVGEDDWQGTHVGVIDYIWFGCEEMVNIRCNDGKTRNYMATEVTRLQEPTP